MEQGSTYVSLAASQDSPSARTLVATFRHALPVVSRCATYEFEDVIAEVDAVEAVDVNPRPWSRRMTRLETMAPPLFAPFSRSRLPNDRRYELLFVAVHSAADLRQMQPLGRFLASARMTACHIDEIWAHDILRRTGELALLRRFDLLFTACLGGVEALQEATGRPCQYLPPSVDALRFCPYPANDPRVVDVYLMGRRRRELHQALREATRSSGRIYLFDTALWTTVYDATEHRLQLAEIAKRSKYFVVDIAKADRPGDTGQQQEIGTRYFEGAAAGSVLVGVVPRSAAFGKLFGWQDSVIPMEASSAGVAALLAELDGDPTRVERIRRENAAQSLRLHDGVYRWEQVLRAAGLEPLPALQARKQRLAGRAQSIEDAARAARAEANLSDGR